jgi:hypothetical protein
MRVSWVYGVQRLGEADDLGEHPVAGDDDHQRHARQLRHERQRLLLDLRRRLDQADEQADRERHAEHGRRELRREQDRLHCDVDYRSFVHGCLTFR